MKTRLCVAILTLCLFFAAVPAAAKGQDAQTNPVTATSYQAANSLTERKARRDWWVKCAEEVVQKTDDEEARNLLSFFKENESLGIPQGDSSFLLIEPWMKKESFTFVPLLDNDPLASQSWQNDHFGDALNLGGYTQKMLVLQGCPVSNDWAGILLLSITHNIQASCDEKFNPRDPASVATELRDAAEFEQRLTSELGGQAYTEIVDTAVQKVADGAKKTPHGEKPTVVQLQLDSVDNLLAKCQSVPERVARIVCLRHAILFTFIDRYADGDKEAIKASVILRQLTQPELSASF